MTDPTEFVVKGETFRRDLNDGTWRWASGVSVPDDQAALLDEIERLRAIVWVFGRERSMSDAAIGDFLEAG